MRSIFISLCIMLVATTAAAQDFTWTGWFGPEGSDAAWGHEWTYDNHTYSNGWGLSWPWQDARDPYYPGANSWVLIPDGSSVEVEGGQSALCGNLTVEAGASLQLIIASVGINGPTLDNDGFIELTNYGANYATFSVNAPLEITGGGEIHLASGRFLAWSPITVTVGSEQTIHGAGAFGWEPYGNYTGVYLTNYGAIRANNGINTLDILGHECTNNGTLEATNASTLRVWGDWTNNGGEFFASDGGIVSLMSSNDHPAHIDGGILRTTTGGEIQPSAYSSVKNVTLEGTFRINRYSGVHLSDIFTNNGVIEQGTPAGAGSAIIEVDSALTFAGNGVLRMGDGNSIQMFNWPDHNARVTNGPQHTIEVYGGNFGREPDYYGDRQIELVNEGTILCRDATYRCEFRMSGSGFENRGDLVIEPSATMDTGLWGDFIQTAGSTRIDDAFIAHSGGFTFTGGILSGQGNLQGSVTVGGSATINPGGIEETGTLDIWGPLNLNDGATLVCDWLDGGTDLLAVHGLATTSGNLTVQMQNLDSAKGTDVVVLRAGDHADSAVWTLDLPSGWSYASLEWIGHDLVVRGLSGMVSGVEDLPAAVSLLGATPNPFNPRTTVTFVLDQAGPVELWVADLAGRRVRSLVNEFRSAGEQSTVWDGLDATGRSVSSGTYICVLKVQGEMRTARMTLVR